MATIGNLLKIATLTNASKTVNKNKSGAYQKIEPNQACWIFKQIFGPKFKIGKDQFRNFEVSK